MNRPRPVFAPLVRLVGAVTLIAAASNCNDFGGATRITQPGDSGPASLAAAPTVAIVVPANGAVGVDTLTRVVVQFSETMDTNTINSSTFFLTPSGGSPVPGTILFHGSNMASFDASSPLKASTTYTVTVTSGAKNLSGVGISPPLASTFTTTGAVDTTPPTVTSVTPLNAATNVAVNTAVIVNFSEAMTAATVNTSTFTLTPTSGGPPVAATVNYNANSATLTPSSALASSTGYTVNVTSGAKDVANNGLTPFSSTFTTAAGGDVTPPTVAMVSPLNGATGVATNAGMIFRFSEPMNQSTINSSTVTLVSSAGGSPVAGVFTFHLNNTVLFQPSSPLAGGTAYVFTVTTGAKDLAGNGLATNFTSTFTTAGGDTTPPTVTSVSPLNAAANVAVNTTVVVNFSEAMTAATVNTSTFTLTPTSGGSPVAATVSYNANAATLTPSSSLSNSTSYTVNVTSGAKDLANNGLTAFSSTFTTAAGGDITPPTVSMVSPLNGATGVATSAGMIFKFSEPMNLSTINTSTVTLVPSAGGSPIAGVFSFHLNNTVLFQPSAALAGGTSYLFTVTTGAKDVAGNGLASDFTSSFATAGGDTTPPTVTSVSPVNAASNVPVNSAVTVTFSEAMTAATVNTTTFTLTPTSGGAPVAATVNYIANAATLTPSAALAFSTGYTVNVTSGAKDLANNGLTPFSSTFTTAAAPDITPPTVTSVSPLNAATNVAVNATVTVNFSEAMSAATVNTSTFTLSPTSGGSPVAATVSYNANAATLTPSSVLANSTSYTVNVTSAAKDLANNGLTPFGSTFTTAAGGDITPPTVAMVSPLDGATGVATSAGMIFRFSEAMNLSTINTSTVTLVPSAGGPPIAGVLSFHLNNTVLFQPSSALAGGTSYLFTVTTGAKDVAGNGLAANFTITFTTAGGDTTPPTVANVTPLNAATNVPVNSAVTVTFSEAMTAATVNTSTFTLTPTSGGSPVAATVNYNGNAATLTPSSALAFSASYTVNVTSGAKDLANNALTPFSSTFTTAAAPDVTPPTITSVSPLDGATNVPPNTSVVVTFSEAMTAATVNSSTFTLTPNSGGGAVSATITYNGAGPSATLAPSSALAYNTTYTVNVSSSAKDLANNGLVAFTSTFTTPPPPDLTPPTVTSVSPANRSVNIDTGAQVRVTFSEPLNPASVSSSNFTVLESYPGGSFLSGTRTYEPATNTIVFTPSVPLLNHRSYLVTVSPGITDIAGNSLSAASTTCFTPTAGAGTPMETVTGFWAQTEACQDLHFHVPIVQTGNSLSLGACSPSIYCVSSALTEAGRVYFGGSSCVPSPLGPPRLCDINVVSVSGTVSGTSVTFTMVMDNGLSFTFNGSIAATGTVNPFFTGTISGATLPPVGINFEREGQ